MACASGDYHTIALSESGEVHSFGRNNEGQLGFGHNDNVSYPFPISNLPKIKEISCGRYFTVCIDQEGGLWSFGENFHGQLGTGNSKNFNIPQKIADIPPVRSVSCGYYHTLIITIDTNLWSCGSNAQNQLCSRYGADVRQLTYQRTLFENISKIRTGAYYSLFQNESGEIFGCGQNNNGEVGLGHFNPQVRVTSIPNSPLNIVQFCSGYNHSLFLDSNGDVFSVGYNLYGNLGLGHNNNQNVFNQIPNIPKICMISCVGNSSYLIDSKGNIWSFGYNSTRKLGHSDKADRNVPTKIKSLNNILQTVQGPFGNHFLAKDSQNKIFVVGCNDCGQLGTGNNQAAATPVELDSKYFQIWGPNFKITNLWKYMCLEETMNWNEEEMNKFEFLQPKINQVKINLESNNNNKIKQEFPPKIFETWNGVNSFLTEKYQQIDEKLNKKPEIENQIKQDVNKIENELKEIENQILQLQKRKKELEENNLPKCKKTQSDFKEIFTNIETIKDLLEEMCSDVSIFCENENQLNLELSKLFKQKKFEEFDCSDVSKLLWKMDLVQYQSLFEDNQINGLAISVLSDDRVWEQLGVEKRDCFYISFYFEMMKAPGYFKTFAEDYNHDCCVCSHASPVKTIFLLKEYEIPIEDELILKNNYCAPLLISKVLIKDILGNDLFSPKGIQTMTKLNEWRTSHERHLKQLNKK